MYVDPELLLIDWLPTVVTCQAATDLPADLASQVPFVRITRIGGPDTDPGLDHPTVDVECFHSTRQQARDLAASVQYQLRFTLPGHQGTGGWVSRVSTVNGPAWRPYDDLTVRRYGATYQISTHSPA